MYNNVSQCNYLNFISKMLTVKKLSFSGYPKEIYGTTLHRKTSLF